MSTLPALTGDAPLILPAARDWRVRSGGRRAPQIGGQGVAARLCWRVSRGACTPQGPPPPPPPPTPSPAFVRLPSMPPSLGPAPRSHTPGDPPNTRGVTAGSADCVRPNVQGSMSFASSDSPSVARRKAEVRPGENEREAARPPASDVERRGRSMGSSVPPEGYMARIWMRRAPALLTVTESWRCLTLAIHPRMTSRSEFSVWALFLCVLCSWAASMLVLRS